MTTLSSTVDTPALWLTLVVGLGAGVIGTVVSTMMRISHERSAQLRLRMLECADDFSTAAFEAVDAIRVIRAERALAASVRTGRVEQGLPFLGNQVISTSEAHEVLDRLIRLDARTRLLFGPDSSTAKAAGNLWHRLITDIDGEVALIKAELTDKTGAKITVVDAKELRSAIDEFSRAARRELQGSKIRLPWA